MELLGSISSLVHRSLLSLQGSHCLLRLYELLRAVDGSHYVVVPRLLHHLAVRYCSSGRYGHLILSAGRIVSKILGANIHLLILVHYEATLVYALAA